MSEIAIVFADAEMAFVAVNRQSLRELVRLSGLRVLQDKRVHVGIVYSSQTRLGIVTLEDILE